MFHLMALPIVKFIQNRMIRWLVNNELELIRKEAVVKYCLSIYLETLRKDHDDSQDSLSPGQDFMQLIF
jgi:hypothetical protein